MAAIDRARFDVVPIGIARDGRWLVGGDPLRALGRAAARLALAEGGAEAQTKRELLDRAAAGEATSALARMESSEGLPAGLRESLDVVLILLHGPQGEDGTVQGLFELAGLPYTGAGVLASAIGMDKAAMKDVFRAHGLPMVEHVLVRRHEWQHDPGAVERLVASQLGFPCFVKPANLGSSVGVSRVKAADDLAAAIELAARHDRPHPGRARRAGARGRGRGARQRRAHRLGARRGVLRRRVVRLRDQVRDGPDDVQGARGASAGDDRPGAARSP
jgi:D-alanine-D-alanine ligase